MSDRVNPAARRTVVERDGDRCEYCKTPAQFAPDALTVDHIVPAGRGGSSAPDNLALACQGCNNRKYTRIAARDPVSDRLVPLFHPRRHRRPERFAGSPDGTPDALRYLCYSARGTFNSFSAEEQLKEFQLPKAAQEVVAKHVP